MPRRLTLPTDHLFVAIFSVRVTYTRLATSASHWRWWGRFSAAERDAARPLHAGAGAIGRCSSLIGIRVVHVDSMAWLISGVFAGVAGLLLADLVALNATFSDIPCHSGDRRRDLRPVAVADGHCDRWFAAGIIESVLTAVPALAPIAARRRSCWRCCSSHSWPGASAWRAPRMSARSNSRRLPQFDLIGTERPSRRIHPLFVMIASLAVLTIVIAASAGGYWLTVFTASFAIALATSGTGLLYGRLGLVSLCQFALVGIGGWVALRVFFAFHPPFLLSILAGGAGASVIGVLWGLPALRMRGLHLALATLMLAGAFQVVIVNWSFPNGGDSFLGYMGDKPRVDMARPLLATSDVGYFIYVAIVLALGLALLEWHRHAKPGRAWALISKSEPMAIASGVNVVFYKAWAFALAGFLAGISGGLLAGCYGGLDGGAFTASDSILLFAVTVIGGIADWQGRFSPPCCSACLPRSSTVLGSTAISRRCSSAPA